MEANDRLILWSIGQRALGKMKFEVSQLTWCQSLGLHISDIEVTLNHQGRLHIGRGTTENENLAMTIAFTEAFERVVANTLTSGSNGLAGHDVRNDSVVASRSELVERDAFLVSYLCGTPLVPIDIGIVRGDLQVAVNYLSGRGQSIQIFGLARSGDRFIVMCVVSGLTNSHNGSGINIGLGCELDIKRACEKATFEAIRNGTWAADTGTKIRPTSLRKFLSLKLTTHNDHLSLALDPIYGAMIMKDLGERRKSNTFAILPRNEEFNFNEPPWPTTIPKPPLTFIQCQNDSLQNLFWGPTHLSKLNTARLSSVSENWKNRIHSLPPHPLG